ncbi:MAG: hypothetical protein IJW18_04010 [Lachnospiraceae bacterium]|nr:hypothetical protein [Lachnospiraceae bacterium]
MRNWKKGLKWITPVVLAVMLSGMVVDASALTVLAATDEVAVAYAETPDFSSAKVLTAVDGVLYIDGSALQSEIIPAGNYRLGANITTNVYVYIGSGTSVNLDLNGFTWDMSDKYLSLNGGSKFSLYDTSTNETGKITTSFVKTIDFSGTGSEFYLYSGTVENTSDDEGARAVSSYYGSSNLYGGKIKSNAYALLYSLSKEGEINLGETVLECGEGCAQIKAQLGEDEFPQTVIDVSDYTGDMLTVDAELSQPGKIKIFKGIQSTEDAAKYIVNVRFDEYYNLFLEKEEYDATDGAKFVYVSTPTFTQQPTEENDCTIVFNHPDAALQWCEVNVVENNTYALAEGELPDYYEVEAGDVFILSVEPEDSNNSFSLEMCCNNDYEYFIIDNNNREIIKTFDSAADVEFYLDIIDNISSLKVEHIRYTEFNVATGNVLQSPKCGTKYICKATVGEKEYLSDIVEITKEHNYIYSENGNTICEECDVCGNVAGTLTVTAEDGIYDGTTTYGATVTGMGTLANKDVTVNYYNGDTLIGSNAPMNAGRYTAKITCEETTASVEFTIGQAIPEDIPAPTATAIKYGETLSSSILSNGWAWVDETIEPDAYGYYDAYIEVDDNNYNYTNVEGYDPDMHIVVRAVIVTIDKVEPTEDMFIYTEPSSLEYDEQEKIATVSSTKNGIGAITVKYYKDGDEVGTTAPPIDVGEYIVRISVAAGENFEAIETEFEVGRFTIVKAESEVVTAPQANASIVYNGSEQELIDISSVSAIGGTMWYKLNNGDWSTTVPVATNAGEYSVYYKVVGDANHKDSEPVAITVNISKATPYIAEVPVASGIIFGDTLGDSVLSGGKAQREQNDTEQIAGTFSWNNVNEKPMVADANVTEYEVVFEPTDTVNYKSATSKVTLPVAKRSVNVPEKDTTVYTYTGNAQTYRIASSPYYTIENAVQTNAGTYEVSVVLDNDNCAWSGELQTFEFEIKPATVNIKADNFTIESGAALPNFTYKVAGLVNGESLPIAVNVVCEVTDTSTAGSYKITVSGTSADGNYVYSYENGTLYIEEEDYEPLYWIKDSWQGKTGWQKISGEWYYFTADGDLETGWVEDTDGKWYYMEEETCEMQTGWVRSKKSGLWYYMDSVSGCMQSDRWLRDAKSGLWYYLDANGAMCTGWNIVNGEWYLLGSDGAMLIGWQKVGDKEYYLDENGKCLINTTTPDGSKVDETGAKIK